jgi:anaerobic ribonucleoside-triphosphate reductase
VAFLFVILISLTEIANREKLTRAGDLRLTLLHAILMKQHEALLMRHLALKKEENRLPVTP